MLKYMTRRSGGVRFLLHIGQAPISNLGQEINYYEWGFSWIFSVPAGKHFKV
jgi:hypothetical protein